MGVTRTTRSTAISGPTASPTASRIALCFHLSWSAQAGSSTATVTRPFSTPVTSVWEANSVPTISSQCSNTAAIAMYERLGFRRAGRRRGYYHDNGEDALIMWLGRQDD